MTTSPSYDKRSDSSTPSALPVIALAIPRELRDRAQWVCWRWTWTPANDTKPGRWTKPPVNARTGSTASVTNPADWSDVATAHAAMQRHGWPGLGFVLTADDGLTGIDLDKCRNPKTGELEPWAAAIVDDLDSYAEASPSGTGGRIIVRGALPEGVSGRRTTRAPLIETYTSGRYLTFTGQRLPGAPATIHARQDALDAFFRRTFPAPAPTAPAATAGHASPAMPDSEIVKRASDAANGATFRRLYFDGDVRGHGGDDSAADLALCAHLAFWTQDAAQIDRLVQRSALSREKWNRDDYRDRTIAKALAGGETYQPAGGLVRLHVNGHGDHLAPGPVPLTPRTAHADPWPTLAPEALTGLAGDVVTALDPTTEADPVAVLVTFLVMFGSAVNRGPHLMVGDDRHGANLNAVLVGNTSTARKGTSQSGPQRLMTLVDPTWASERVQGGLSTGEGLVWHIRDARYGTNKKGETVLEDAGVTDKRLLCIEEELSFILKTAQRQGNTITEIIRRAWDSRESLRVMTKGSPATATKPHVSILGHITREELSRHLTETELANGFANRYAWFAVRRSKALPEPVRLPHDDASELARRIHTVYAAALKTGELHHEAEARAAWKAVYPPLSDGRPGLGGALTARAAPIVRRLSLVYALLDCSSVISLRHLEAAIALWDYAEASVRLIFGDLTGDPIADRVLAALRSGQGLRLTDLHELFGRNVPAGRLGQALELLTAAGRVTITSQEPDGRGRPSTIITATEGTIRKP